MKTATILGIALIVLGVVAFTYQGITYTTREKVIDLGPLQATVDKKETIPLTPLVGGLALVGGIALLISGARKVLPGDTRLEGYGSHPGISLQAQGMAAGSAQFSSWMYRSRIGLAIRVGSGSERP